MRRLILLRPEPGLARSAARAREMGLEVVETPLTRVEPIAAEMPEGGFDALLLTSANAVRHAGALLAKVAHLPVHAVGEATADAAREAGLDVVAVGEGGVEGLTMPPGRLLHVCGERHRPLAGQVTALAVYRTVAIAGALPALADSVVAVHSPAAGEQLDALAGETRGGAIIAAISAAAADACGTGWERVEHAQRPDDESLLALAARLCQTRPR